MQSIQGGLLYPIFKKKNLTHDLLNLYGTHWSYLVDIDNWKKAEKREGDSEGVLQNIRAGSNIKNFAKYAFTQKYLNKFSSLWVFGEGTPSWRYHQNILIPKFNLDVQEYKFQKKVAKQNL